VSTHAAEQARAEREAAELLAATTRREPTAEATAVEARFRAAIHQALNALCDDWCRHPGTVARMPTDIAAFVCGALERDLHLYQAANRTHRHAAEPLAARPLLALPATAARTTGKEAAA